MARRTSLLVLCALAASSFFMGCGANTASRSQAAEGPAAQVPIPPKPVAADSGKVAEPLPPPPAHADSTGPEARPQVLVEGVDFTGVRTRLIPHVMSRGWMLSVNKSDSIEFRRPADPDLSQAIFGIVPPRGTRINLRFRLTALPEGTRIELLGRLVGPSGPLPYRASAEVLAANLEEMRHDILTAPVSTDPQVDRVKK